MSFSRRDFLQLLAAGGALGTTGLPGCDDGLPLDRPVYCAGRLRGEAYAAGHAHRDGLGPWPLGPASADAPLRDVVIVGAGLSGLTAAWALHRAGVDDLVVLERADEVGGVARGGHLDGQPCPWGAHYMGLPDPDSPVLMHLLSDLGVIVDVSAKGAPVIAQEYRVAKPVVNLYHGQSWSRGFYPWALATPRDLDQLKAFYRDMDRWSRWTDRRGRPAFQLPVAYASDDEEVQALDRLSLADYLTERGWDSPHLRWYIDNRMTDEYGCRAHEISAYAAILFWAAEGGVRKAAQTGEPQPDLISWPEGNMFLARRLQRYLPRGGLRLQAFVVDVRHHGDEVHVTTWDPARRTTTVHRARTCIFAAPKLAAGRVIPELEDRGRLAWSALRYTPWLVANLRVTKAPDHAAEHLAWDNLIHDSWSLGFINGHHLRRPGQDADDAFVLTFYACFSGAMREPARRDLLELDWDPWARLIVHELERAAPKIRPLIERLDIWRWGHAMVQPAPGVIWGGLRDELTRPLGRIFFAGNDVGGLPLYEEAAYRGVLAAEQALETLDRRFSSLLARTRDPGSQDARGVL